MDDDEFKEHLRSLLLEIDIESCEYPDPDYAGAMIWDRYLRKQGIENAEFSNEMKKYESELYEAKDKQEKEELMKKVNK